MIKFLKNLFKINKKEEFKKFKEGDVIIRVDKEHDSILINSETNREIGEEEMLSLISKYLNKIEQGEI